MYRLPVLAVVVAAIILVRSYTASSDSRFVFYVNIPPPLETEIGDRDLSLYDYGGHIPNCGAILYDEGDEKKADECFGRREEARKFIETHFREQRRGYVIVDAPDGDLYGPTYFFIEPSELGPWEVRVRFHQRGPYTRFRRNFNTAYYTELFRRRIPPGHGLGRLKDGTNALVLRSRGVYELIL